MVKDWREIYEFWFGEAGRAEHGSVREIRFRGGPDVGAEIRQCFSAKFVRFLHRNHALGRTDMIEEAAWLASIEERFGVTGNEVYAS